MTMLAVQRAQVSVCFVCLGNICRSPTAEGVMKQLVAQAGYATGIEVDSAGTAAYHSGERADPRSRAEAKRRGVELTSVARQFVASDFKRFDYVLAMDRSNLRDLERLAGGPEDRAKLHLLRSFELQTAAALDVPDPYYGGDRGFADVYEICQASCRGLLQRIVADHPTAQGG